MRIKRVAVMGAAVTALTGGLLLAPTGSAQALPGGCKLTEGWGTTSHSRYSECDYGAGVHRAVIVCEEHFSGTRRTFYGEWNYSYQYGGGASRAFCTWAQWSFVSARLERE